MNDLDKKIKFAIHLLQSIPQDGELSVSVSGGKDSDVIFQLAKEAGIPFKAEYKNTTIDPPHTLAHVKSLGATILNPEKTFFQLVREKGTPNRWLRFCCAQLKEYKTCERQVIGVRRSESIKRAKIYQEPEECRRYPKGEKVKLYYPILEWTDDDVATFIKDRGIKCHPLYYDEAGIFHVERRLGCMCCPLQSVKKRREEFLKYPKILRLYVANLQIFLDNAPVKSAQDAVAMYEGKAENRMFFELFADWNIQKYKQLIGGGYFSRIEIGLQAIS